MTTELQQELDTFKRDITGWSDQVGKFVLIKNREVTGFYSTYEDAITEGYRRFQLEPFLVKQVSVIEQACFNSPSARTAHAPLHPTT